MRSLAARATAARRSSGDASGCGSSSNVPTAMPEATSPARAPPMPSATANSGLRSRYESSFPCRARPTSDSAAFSTTRNANRLLLVPVLGLADADAVRHLQLLGPAQLATVQICPVGRAHVFYVHELAARKDPGVGGRRERVLDRDVRAGPATHGRRVADLEHGARREVHRGHDLEPRADALAQVHAAAALTRGLRRGAARHGHVGVGAAGQVAPRAAHDPQQEQVEDGQEAELECDCYRVVHGPGYSCSKRRRIRPRVTSSPSCSSASATRWPLTLMPLVDPRSATTQERPSRRTSAWRREVFGSSSWMSHSRLRPIRMREPDSTVRLPAPTRNALPLAGASRASSRRASL